MHFTIFGFRSEICFDHYRAYIKRNLHVLSVLNVFREDDLFNNNADDSNGLFNSFL